MSTPAFVVHDLGQAKAALQAARERGLCVCLVSAPGAAAVLGPAVWREMMAEAARTEPGAQAPKTKDPAASFAPGQLSGRPAPPGALAEAILDCGRDPGVALAALREGVLAIAVEVPGEVLAKIADIAGQCGATVRTRVPSPAFDLGEAPDPLAAARAWLNGRTP